VSAIQAAVYIVYPFANSVRLCPFEALADGSVPDARVLRNGLEWTSTSKVFVGGMEFRSVAPDVVFQIDPLNAHVHSVGCEVYFSILGGILLIAVGVIDWLFQYTRSQNSSPGWAM